MNVFTEEEYLRKAESHRKVLDVLVNKGKAVERLLNNEDFKELFIEDLEQTELHRLVCALGSGDSDREALVNQIMSIGYTMNYLGIVSNNAKQAEHEILERFTDE